MQDRYIDAPMSVTLRNMGKCKQCLVPRIFLREIGEWTTETHGRVSRDAIEELIERQCGGCLDSCLAESIDGEWIVDVAAKCD